VKLLLDEMYSASLAECLRAAAIEASTVRELGLAGSSDPEVFAAALSASCVLVTENVADFVRIAAEHLTTGGHHPGILIALSSRFSRRPAGRNPLIAAIQTLDEHQLDDRVIYLERAHQA